MALEIGSRLGHYDVTALIGEGGMGQVYQATDTKLNRQVALKILPEAFASDPDRLARFQREAKVLASLNHPGIAAIHGLEDSDDTKALVLELVEGPTLADRIAQGSIPADEALPIAKQIAEALEAAHEAGVIHRDLKPANIKVKRDGIVKVLDFGLAKALDTTPEGDPSLSPTLTAAATQMGVIMGTAAYMSPEQAAGETADKRSDIWSFGVVLFEMLTGQRVFSGKTVSHVLGAVLQVEPKWDALPVPTPQPLRKLLRRCLEKDHKRRLRDIGDALTELDDALTAEPTDETPVAPATQAAGWRQALPWALGALVVGSVITGIAVWSLRPAPAATSPARFSINLPASDLLSFNNAGPSIALSPDGQTLVYVAVRDGIRQFFRRPLNQLQALPMPGTEGALHPFFAPDSARIGFAMGGALRTMSITGGPPATVNDEALRTGPSWGANNAIVFGGNTPVGDPIMRVGATGGVAEPITTLSEAETDHRWPHLLPDGNALLFTVVTNENFQIAVKSPATGEQQLLGEGSYPRYVSSGHIVFVRETQVWAVPFDANRLELTGAAIPVLEGVRGAVSGMRHFAVAENGTLAYVPVNTGLERTLVWVDRDGTTEVIDTVPPNAFETPRLSPEGDRVLVVADGDAWIYDLASGRETRVTSDGATDGYAGWTPDGEVVYSSERGSGGATNVWIESADGSGEARQLTALDGRVHFDSWAPDGLTFSAHHHPTGPSNQLMVPVDGEPEPWLTREFSDGNAVFSPDGRYAALVSDQTGQREIVIRPLVGPVGQTPVSVGGGEEPAWAANGELFYRRPSDYAMMVVEVTTDPILDVGPPRELFRGTVSPGGSPRARYSVTLDGQRFLMSGAHAASEDTGIESVSRQQINVVLNWDQELLERVPIP